MKRTKEIELNGKTYTLTLNRESFAQIDKICNIRKIQTTFTKQPYEYIDEIDDNYNPLEDQIDLGKIEKQAEEKTEALKLLCERAFFIWQYPTHGLKISEVKEILKPYFEDEEKANRLVDLFFEIMDDCVKLKEDKLVDSKN